ncbi:MAG TPA: hypothetical protein VLB76_23040 [Thermoanaerobaculia bacterium]|nr:hypothetical protein [Thermoanaerobaculia bacterium]
MRQICGLLYRSAALALLLTAGLAAGAAAGPVELISKADPVPDSFGTGFATSMSTDGRYVAFQSDAPNLVPGQVDDNFSYDVFLRDRVAGTITLISHAAGKPGMAGHDVAKSSPYSLDASISADGRYVAFVSLLTDLVPGQSDTSGLNNVFLWDRVTGTTTLISHADGDPVLTGDGHAAGARISADGNYVVFSSLAKNLVPGQTAPPGNQPQSKVYLYDRRSGAVSLLSHASGSPALSANGTSGDAAISGDGAYVVFGSTAPDLLPGLTNAAAAYQVFLYERASGALSLVSHASGSPLVAGNGGCGRLQLSADGRWIAFASTARNLVAGQIGSASPNNAFLYDRVSKAIRLASHTSASPLTAASTETGFEGGMIALSADGRYLAFTSSAPDVVSGQMNLASGSNVFVYDRVSGGIILVSHNRDSRTTTPTHPGSRWPSLSADGRYIAFVSPGADLVPHQTDNAAAATDDVFVYDQIARTTVLASHVRGSLTTAANGRSGSPLISADGGVVAFGSFATDLAEGQADPNGFQDLFLFERRPAEVTALSQRAPELPALTPVGPSSAAGISADGRFVVFVSEAAGLVPGQVDTPYSIDPYDGERGTWDVFLRDRTTGKTTLLSRSKASPPTAMGGGDPALSADGSFAAFGRIPDSQGGLGELYLYDRAADSLTLVNHPPGSPAQSDGYPEFRERPAFSADGRYMAYACRGCHLVPGQQSGSPGSQADIFLYDRVTGTNTLVSHASGSLTTTGDHESLEPRISADGRFVVFISSATGLVAGQTGPPRTANVFVFDRATGAVTLASHAAGSATAAADGTAYNAGISADGRWIVFRSTAADLVPGQIDTNGLLDFFLYDRVSGATALISHASSSPVTAGSTDLDSYSGDDPVALSADGRWIVFASQATDLVAGEANPNQFVNVYLYDRLSGGVSLVSSAAGVPNLASYAREPGISADGSRITFVSGATDLVPGAGPFLGLFVQERATGARALAARVLQKASYPALSGNISRVPRLSASGRFVAFTSDVKLVEGDYNGTWDAFVFDAAAVVPPPPGDPVQVPPCALFTGSLRSNARKVLKIAGSCGVPAGAKRVAVKLTVSQGTGQGNVQLYPGNVRTPAAGILRFQRGQTSTASFDLPLSTNGTGTLALLPFVRGNGTVRVSVEIDGYVP